MKNKKLWIILVAVVLLVAGGGIWYIIADNEEAEDVVTEELAPEVEAEDIDDGNPYVTEATTEPIRGTNQELYDKTIEVLEAVFDDVKVIGASSDETEFRFREELTYMTTDVITIEDAEQVRTGLEEAGIDVTGAQVDVDKATYSYEVELDGNDYSGNMQINLGDRYSFLQQKIEQIFTHIPER